MGKEKEMRLLFVLMFSAGLGLAQTTPKGGEITVILDKTTTTTPTSKTQSLRASKDWAKLELAKAKLQAKVEVAKAKASRPKVTNPCGSWWAGGCAATSAYGGYSGGYGYGGYGGSSPVVYSGPNGPGTFTGYNPPR